MKAFSGQPNHSDTKPQVPFFTNFLRQILLMLSCFDSSAPFWSLAARQCLPTQFEHYTRVRYARKSASSESTTGYHMSVHRPHVCTNDKRAQIRCGALATTTIPCLDGILRDECLEPLRHCGHHTRIHVQLRPLRPDQLDQVLPGKISDH